MRSVFARFPARQLAAVAVLLVTPLCVGCPDYSEHRDVPDYENMVDDGGDEMKENEK